MATANPARFRQGLDKLELLEPNKAYEFTVDMVGTAVVFQPGHRIRVDITSSDFPQFDRNLNTGGNNYDESKGVVAHNAVHHSKQYPSQVTVTVIRRGAAPSQLP